MNLIHNSITKVAKAYVNRLLGNQGKVVSLEKYRTNHPENVKYIEQGEETLFCAYAQKSFRYENIIHNYGNIKTYVLCLKNASCFAYSNLIKLSDGNYYVEDSYLPIIGHASDCSDGFILTLDKWYGKVVSIPNKCVKLERGIFMSGLFSWNYWHYTYQVIPRMKDIAQIPTEVPILVDKKAIEIPSFKQLLDICNVSKREIFVLEDKVEYKVASLYLVSAQTLCLPNLKTMRKYPDPSVLYRESVLNYLSSLCLQNMSQEQQFPKRIFISRKYASARRPFNEKECIEVVGKYGFQIVYPEQYSLYEQMNLFHTAEIIVGGTGAAFTNLVYCKPGVKVIVLSKELDVNKLWQTIIEYIGGKMCCVFETERKSNTFFTKRNAHAPFRVNVSDFERVLKECIYE